MADMSYGAGSGSSSRPRIKPRPKPEPKMLKPIPKTRPKPKPKELKPIVIERPKSEPKMLKPIVKRRPKPTLESLPKLRSASRPDVNHDLYTNFNFVVYVGNTCLKFSKLSNIESEVELEEFEVGGINSTPYFNLSPSKKSGRLVFEKGMVVKENEKIKGWRAGCKLPYSIHIFLNSNNGQKSGTDYCVSGGMIVKWELAPLDAMGSEILIQKFEVAYRELLML